MAKFEWWWGPGVDPEIYASSEPTREGAILAARAEYGIDGVFTIIEAAPADFPRPTAKDVIEAMFDHAADAVFLDEGGSVCEPQGSKEDWAKAEEALDVALHGWFLVHSDLFPCPSAFGATRNRYVFNAPPTDALRCDRVTDPAAPCPICQAKPGGVCDLPF